MKFRFVSVVGTILLAATGVFAQSGDFSGHGDALVTVLPNKSGEQTMNITKQDISQINVGGKNAQVTGFGHLGANNPVELVILIDSSAGSSFGTQMSSIKKFVQEMPPNTKMAIAYMQNGAAVFSGQQFSSDPSQVLKGLHLPSGFFGINASPYFSLSDLAKHWPSNNPSARRIVAMITDGVDYYNLRYDPQDPYVRAAIDDSVRNGLSVYAMYWADNNRISRMGWAQDAGQNLLLELTSATGGHSYWQGYGNPVSFQPYFQDLRRRLENQFGLEFAVQLNSKDNSPQIERLNLKINAPNAKVDAPQKVFVRPGGAQQQPAQ